MHCAGKNAKTRACASAVYFTYVVCPGGQGLEFGSPPGFRPRLLQVTALIVIGLLVGKVAGAYTLEDVCGRLGCCGRAAGGSEDSECGGTER